MGVASSATGIDERVHRQAAKSYTLYVELQVLAGSFPGVSNFSPLLVADHVTAL
jgi:hypothetical protein